MLSVAEFGRIYLADRDEVLPGGHLALSKSHFGALMGLLEQDRPDAPDYQPAFVYARPQGREQLRVQNHVGVVRLADGVQIEILPKLSKRLEPSTARALLVQMLVELVDSPFLEGTLASLDAHRMPLFELVLRCFLEQVASIVRKGIARSYVTRQDNLVFLRGKLKLAEQIRHNACRPDRIYCEFDEYDIDRPINRLIKGALLLASRIVRLAENQQRCRELLFWFESVPATKDHPQDFRRMQRDRLIQHYAPAMPLCRLILEQLNPLTQQGENRAVSMLFPMETVFESYVAAKLPRILSGWRVETQVTGKALVDDHRGRRLFNLRPDLRLSREGRLIIADTKWKLIDQSDVSNRYGISQADIYQLFGYCSKYLAGQPIQQVMLIYPASETFDRPLEPFWYRAQEQVLYVVPYDLLRDELLLPAELSGQLGTVTLTA